LVATPGRLIDFVNRRLITFFSIRYFILDEADRLLDMGFQGDIEQILCHHTMVFTVSTDIFPYNGYHHYYTYIYNIYVISTIIDISTIT
jgi:hypothetical protein